MQLHAVIARSHVGRVDRGLTATRPTLAEDPIRLRSLLLIRHAYRFVLFYPPEMGGMSATVSPCFSGTACPGGTYSSLTASVTDLSS
jgi:hypothetical protein